MENIGKPKSKSSLRKGKKDWKKNIDISEVENELDEIRKEEIAFGGKIEEQANEDLFTIDVEGDTEVKRKNKSKKLLTIDEILKPQSKVKSFGSGRSNNKNVSRYNLSKYTKEKINQINKRKSERKIKNVNKKRKTGSIIARDLWEEADNVEPQEINFFNQPKPKAPNTLKYNKLIEKIDAVKVGHPGTSYNPTFTDHQDALRIAVDIEQKKEDEKLRIEKELSYPPELDEVSDHEIIDNDSDDEEEETEEENIIEQKVVKTGERKTKAQRNKEKKNKEKNEKRLAKLKEKEMSKQIDEIEKIQKAIDDEEKNTIEKMNKPKREKMPRLGKVKYQEKSMDIQLTEELSESLRSLKPEGNLFTDRFKSLQERAIIEPRVRNTKERRYKLKEYEKHSYKKFK
ncbi:P60-like protein [Neocallimastix lanati (nom. inval.)]|jgi:nucleolar protein 53|uniref:Ribosome biogenesis protein NOP53 n=1 Tax=Neocallimastix californiae TaxID=1754190 RepID=A0A1Y2DWV7_9FUNG|nr:P60-like protein [Neocallimastix sp. JGI-2020a]ORY63782.1 P60-like protein [Neocallimastix californiae]|eukprot:ORY63782.1 P60-like protein [Neocallimastix californiae]